jgi:hypothetical protein
MVYTVINRRFAGMPWTGTIDEIIDAIVDCNLFWETAYSKKSFEIKADGLYCDGELIAEPALLQPSSRNTH